MTMTIKGSAPRALVAAAAAAVAAFGLFAHEVNLVADAQQPARMNQKGLPMYATPSCAVFDMHTTSKWWYSWELTSGFDGYGAFCDDPDAAAADARALGIDFVPMYKKAVPTPPYDYTGEVALNLNEAEYLMTLNEPERDGWFGTTPEAAAAMWPDFVNVTELYNISTIVAPCTTAGNGMKWYEEWLGNCTLMHGQDGCRFDHSCIHFYYQPWDPTLNDGEGGCDPAVVDWACVGANGEKAQNSVNQYYSAFGKPVWVTEFACSPWGGGTCDEEKHLALMEQVMPVLHDNPVSLHLPRNTQSNLSGHCSFFSF